jgi:uncharacterized protein
MRRLAAALLAGAALAAAQAAAEVPVPPLRARVTDLTGTLAVAERRDLESRLAAFEERRGTQIAVLVVPTTKPEEIEQYSIRVAEAWKIGRKGVDDGLIVVVAKKDRRVRIEVGYGLEGAIPDSVAKRVIDEHIVPRFREGDFYGGLRDGVEVLMRLAEGEKLPPPAPRTPIERFASLFEFPTPWPATAAVFTIAFVAGGLLSAALGRLRGSLAAAPTAGVIAWAVLGIETVPLAALLAFLFACLPSTPATGSGGFGGGSGRGGGWSGGGGGSGGGGWRGGGGGFGGGGASGRW